MNRRNVLQACIGSLGLASAASAQTSRTMKVVVPYPPGGGADLLARAFTAFAAGQSGRSIIVENRGGATGTIGSLAVARATADGDTILQGDSACLVVQPLANKLPYTVADFAPVARLTTNPVVLATSGKGRLKTVEDVLRLSRQSPGALTCGSNGVLSHFHIALEQIKAVADIDILHVPFQGTPPGVIAVLGGQIDLVVVPPGVLNDPGNSELKGLAVASEQRLPELPGVPTFREAGLDLVTASFRGLVVPKATPIAAIATIERWVKAAFADGEFLRQIRSIGETPAPLDASSFGAFLDQARVEMLPIIKRLSPS